jgi:hypothetical protein
MDLQEYLILYAFRTVVYYFCTGLLIANYCTIIILSPIFKNLVRGWGHELDYLAPDTDRWRAVVDAVMNLRFS